MSNLKSSEVRHGLENVLVAETEVSDVQGGKGLLVIRGYGVEELAELSPFAATAALVWEGALPSRTDEEALSRRLAEARVRVHASVCRLAAATNLPPSPLEFQRAALAVLDREDPVAVTALMPVAAAAWYRIQSGRTPVVPDASLDHASDFLRILTGNMPSKAATQALDRYLTTVSDHGMNASTFATRVVASTGSDLISAVAAGLGALKGPLHGGAPGPVLDMLDAIGVPERAATWIEDQLARGHRIMGMGHRVYKVRDPRAAVLEKALDTLERGGVVSPRLALARAVEKVAASSLKRKYPGRELHANVEFYTAVLLDVLGIPREAFTATFAVGRVLGWCAHFAEQRATGRLIRPDSLYVGKSPQT